MSVIVISCDGYVELGVRSGSTQDDYMEEPLASSVEKYAQTLHTANLFIEAVRNSAFEDAYALCDTDIQAQLTEKLFKVMFAQVDVVAGSLSEYKKNQWSFNFEAVGETDLVIMTKIVKHEQKPMHYIFSFEKNGSYEKIKGLSLKEKTGLIL